MDLEFDSDLEDVSEFDFSQGGVVQPYLYEPIRNVVRESSSESDSDESDSSAISSSDEAGIVPDVSAW